MSSGACMPINTTTLSMAALTLRFPPSGLGIVLTPLRKAVTTVCTVRGSRPEGLPQGQKSHLDHSSA